MSNQVLALKYRPKQFSDLIGQEAISTTLSLALDTNKIANAYLFSGLRGSGKTSSARIFAKGLVCKNAPTSRPCEECDGCKSANSGNHIDIIELDAASNRGIDDIKELIEHTKYKPAISRYKIFIIDEVHMLTTQAFNALLKTLEEPPEYVKFILATTDPLKLPATILSRTQHFRFKKIAPNIILNHLVHILTLEKVEFEKKALELIVRSGNGSLRDTLTLLDQAIIYSKNYISVDSVTNMLGLIEPNLIKEIFLSLREKNNINEILEKFQDYEITEVLEQISLYIVDSLKEGSVELNGYDKLLKLIANSKQLLSFNTNSTFVLIYTLMGIKDILNTQKDVNPDQNKQAQTYIQSQPNLQPSNKTQNNNQQLFNQIVSNIKKFSFDIGECFEKSFKFNSFDGNRLIIDSYAQGECKILLYKHFAKIRQIIDQVYNKHIEIDFNKKIKKDISPKTLTQKIEKISKMPTIPQTSSMVEDIEFGSGCVNSMGAIKNPKLSQKEFDLEELKKSSFIQTAIKLFSKEDSEIAIKSKV